MAPFKRGSTYWLEFVFHGVRIRGCSKLGNNELPRKVETATRNEMALGAGGVPEVPTLSTRSMPTWSGPHKIPVTTEGLRCK
jgi:hypothetical protein